MLRNDGEIQAKYERRKAPIVENGTIEKLNDITNFIKNCPLNLNVRSLVMKGMFTMLGPLKYEAMVFLFEDVVIFTQYSPTDTQEQYMYVDSIEVDDLGIVTFEGQSLLFHLVNFPKSKDRGGLEERYTYVLQSTSLRVKEIWVQYIVNRLWEQLKQCKGGMSLTDDGGNLRVKTIMEKAPLDTNLPNTQPSQALQQDMPEQRAFKIAVDINSPNLQLSKVLQNGMRNRSGATNVTNAKKYCLEDLSMQTTVEMDSKQPNLQLSDVVPPEIKVRSGNVTSPLKCRPAHLPPPIPLKVASKDDNNSPNLQLSKVLQDEMNNQGGTTNVMKVKKYCPGDLPMQAAVDMDLNPPNLQFTQQKIKEQSGVTDATKSINCRPPAPLPRQKSLKIATTDNNSSNLVVSKIRQDEVNYERFTTKVTNVNKYCAEDLSMQTTVEMGSHQPNLRFGHVVPPGMKVQNGTADVINPIKHHPAPVPRQGHLKTASEDDNSPNRQLSKVLQDEMNNQSGTANTTKVKKFCPDDLPMQTAMNMELNSANIQSSQVLQQEMKNLHIIGDTTNGSSPSIKYCPADLPVRGSLLMKDVFSVHKPRSYDATVFLYEEVIIFTTYQEEMEGFVYVDHIKISDLRVPSSTTLPTFLHLSNYKKVENGEVDKDMFVLEAKSAKVKEDWTEIIKNQLFSQLVRLKLLYKETN